MSIPRYTKVPWGDLEPSDVRSGQSGYFQRDSRSYGLCERQVALAVIGSYDPSLYLGMVAIRCNRQGAYLEPLTLSIPDTVEP